MVCRLAERLLPAALLALLSAPAQAAINVSLDSGTTFSVPNIVDFSPNGFSMAGMKVTAYFSGGSSETATWSATTAIGGHAVGTTGTLGWSLAEDGDTFDHVWTLINNTGLLMTRVVLEGGNFGDTLFDTQGDGTPSIATTPGNASVLTGTDGSQRGHTFNSLNLAAFGIDASVTYRNAVKLDSALTPVGDLYTTLDIGLGTGLISGGATSTFPLTFNADTDLWGTQQAEPLPEPGSLLLFAGLGLAGLWQHRRRQRRL
jgi:PEP-CTERM motif-containing protein